MITPFTYNLVPSLAIRFTETMWFIWKTHEMHCLLKRTLIIISYHKPRHKFINILSKKQSAGKKQKICYLYGFCILHCVKYGLLWLFQHSYNVELKKKHYNTTQVKESLPSVIIQSFHTIHVIEAYIFYTKWVHPLQKLNNFWSLMSIFTLYDNGKVPKLCYRKRLVFLKYSIRDEITFKQISHDWYVIPCADNDL